MKPIILQPDVIERIYKGNQTRLVRLDSHSRILPEYWRFDSIWPKKEYGNDCYYVEALDKNGNPLEEYTNIGKSPFGKPLQSLWIQEPWSILAFNSSEKTLTVRYKDNECRDCDRSDYADDALERLFDECAEDYLKAGWKQYDDGMFYLPPERLDTSMSGSPPGRWRSPSTMPRWASRGYLEIQSVTYLRLQDIPDADIPMLGFQRKEDFVADWDANHKIKWEQSPCVWYMTFKAF